MCFINLYEEIQLGSLFFLTLINIFHNKAGILDAGEISIRLSIISERLRKQVEMVQVRQETKGGIPFVIVNQALSTRFLHFIVSGWLDTLNNDTVLILRFARISEKFHLQMGDITIKLFQLV